MTVQTAGEEAGIREHSLLPLPSDLIREIQVWIDRQPLPQPTVPQAVEEFLRRSLKDRPCLAEFST